MSKPFLITILVIAIFLLIVSLIIAFYPVKIEQVSPGGEYAITPLPLTTYLESDYWDGYTKPEGWVTLENEEHGFSVDIPAEWETYSDSETSLIFNASDGMLISSGHGIKVRFAINDDIGKLPKLKDNDARIALGGNAFKYFRIVYSRDPDTQGDDLIVYYPEDVVIEDSTIQDNFIEINENREGDITAEDLQTIKTIINSFRRY